MEKKKEEKMEGEITDDNINIIDYLIILAKRKKIIIAITLTAFIGTIIYSLLLPIIYKAETRIIAVGETNRTSFLMEKIGSIAGLTSSSGGFKNPLTIIGIIKSRTISDRIIERFGLMDSYKAQNMEAVREKLGGSLMIDHNINSKIISISVLNKDPKLAAEMADAFVEELKKFLQGIALSEASRRKIFFEGKLEETKEALIKSEEAMREFQEKTGILKVEDQARAVIESIANIRAQIAVKEVEIKVMKTYSTLNNPDLQMVQVELLGLKAELRKFEGKGGSSPNPLMPTGRMPVVGTDYVRKLRDLKFNEGLFEVILKQYEIARIDESKESAIIQVIDEAVIPENRFRPERTKMVVFATFTWFFFAVFSSLLLEYFKNYLSVSNENREKIETLKRHFSFKRGK
ncbi:MAG TPA: hypothetical protein ENH82_03350 [bacterium]|nr:hypothetical protein [bacterium]